MNYLIVVVLVMFLIQSFFAPLSPKMVPYSEFKKMIKKGKIKEVIFTDFVLRGVLIVTEEAAKKKGFLLPLF